MTPDILSDALALGLVLVVGGGLLFWRAHSFGSADSMVPPRPRLNMPDARRPRVIAKSEEKEAEIEAKRQAERAEKGLD